jgi:hypothetical protein
MTGHLTSTLELWRLSLLTGHLLAEGSFRFGHRPEDYSKSSGFTAIEAPCSPAQAGQSAFGGFEM